MMRRSSPSGMIQPPARSGRANSSGLTVSAMRLRTACGSSLIAARMRSRSIPTKTRRRWRRASASRFFTWALTVTIFADLNWPPGHSGKLPHKRPSAGCDGEPRPPLMSNPMVVLMDAASEWRSWKLDFAWLLNRPLATEGLRRLRRLSVSRRRSAP